MFASVYLTKVYPNDLFKLRAALLSVKIIQIRFDFRLCGLAGTLFHFSGDIHHYRVILRSSLTPKLVQIVYFVIHRLDQMEHL